MFGNLIHMNKVDHEQSVLRFKTSGTSAMNLFKILKSQVRVGKSKTPEKGEEKNDNQKNTVLALQASLQNAFSGSKLRAKATFF